MSVEIFLGHIQKLENAIETMLPDQHGSLVDKVHALEQSGKISQAVASSLIHIWELRNSVLQQPNMSIPEDVVHMLEQLMKVLNIA